MNETVKLLAVFGAMIVVYAIIIPSARPSRISSGKTQRLRARKWSFLGRYESTSIVAAVLLMALAVTELFGDRQSAVPVSASLGALIGVIGALMNNGGVRLVRDWLFGVTGLVAAIVSGIRFVTAPNLSMPVELRLSLLAGILLCYLLGSVFGKGLAARDGLVIFALVDIAVFFSSPAGADLWDLSVTRGWLYLTVVVGSAFLLGFLGGGVPFIIDLFATGAAIIGFGLGQIQNASLAMVVTAVLVAVLVAMVVRPFTKTSQ